MLAERLHAKERIFFDTMAVIYFIETHATYASILRPVFESVDKGIMVGLSSYITLLEVLVLPLRAGALELAQQYRNTLVGSPNFSLFPIEESVAEKAAEIRARYSFKTPDAIQLATAELRGAECFITNDGDLKKFNGVEVLVLDDFVPPPA